MNRVVAAHHVAHSGVIAMTFHLIGACCAGVAWIRRKSVSEAVTMAGELTGSGSGAMRQLVGHGSIGFLDFRKLGAQSSDGIGRFFRSFATGLTGRHVVATLLVRLDKMAFEVDQGLVGGGFVFPFLDGDGEETGLNEDLQGGAHHVSVGDWIMVGGQGLHFSHDGKARFHSLIGVEGFIQAFEIVGEVVFIDVQAQVKLFAKGEEGDVATVVNGIFERRNKMARGVHQSVLCLVNDGRKGNSLSRLMQVGAVCLGDLGCGGIRSVAGVSARMGDHDEGSDDTGKCHAGCLGHEQGDKAVGTELEKAGETVQYFGVQSA